MDAEMLKESVIGVSMKKAGDKVTIKIPRPLYKNLNQTIEGSGFNSVTEFTVYVLREVLAERTARKEPTLAAIEIEMVKNRLKSLGYF